MYWTERREVDLLPDPVRAVDDAHHRPRIGRSERDADDLRRVRGEDPEEVAADASARAAHGGDVVALAGDAEIIARERDPGVAVKIATLDQSEQADL
jgi:hypothetical protein